MANRKGGKWSKERLDRWKAARWPKGPESNQKVAQNNQETVVTEENQVI